MYHDSKSETDERKPNEEASEARPLYFFDKKSFILKKCWKYE
jgi:hypothetical protein